MRLRHVLYMMTNAVIVGSLIVFVLVIGWVGYVPIFGAVALGFLLAWPASILVARWIKVEDPAWNEEADRPTRAAQMGRLATAAKRKRQRDQEPPHPASTRTMRRP
jgi:hypothetical protein